MRLRKTIWISAGHKVHTKKTKCSRLHGHNWKIEISIGGVPKSDGMIVDFLDITELVKALDHKMILSNVIAEEYLDDFDEPYVRFEVFKKGYVLPAEDCVILDIPVVTAEHLAQWIGSQIREKFKTDVWRVIVHETVTSSVMAEGARWGNPVF